MVSMSPHFCLIVAVTWQNNQQQILQTLDAQTASTLDDWKVLNACETQRMRRL